MPRTDSRSPRISSRPSTREEKARVAPKADPDDCVAVLNIFEAGAAKECVIVVEAKADADVYTELVVEGQARPYEDGTLNIPAGETRTITVDLRGAETRCDVICYRVGVANPLVAGSV